MVPEWVNRRAGNSRSYGPQYRFLCGNISASANACPVEGSPGAGSMYSSGIEDETSGQAPRSHQRIPNRRNVVMLLIVLQLDGLTKQVTERDLKDRDQR